jgi:regulator of sirC expression with transglutaminase-like and TPR domain
MAPMDALIDILTRDDSEAPLDLAALELASIEYPHLDPEPFIDILDSYANEIDERMRMEFDGVERLQVLHEFLFREQGFTGNEQDYYNAKNSCLNEVIASRTGIPISLCVVYMAIAERLEMPVYGIGLPGHFLCSYEDEGFQTYIDVFHQGSLMSAEECIDFARTLTGMDLSAAPHILKPVTPRQILIRMLNNLRSIYLRAKEFPKASKVLDLLLQASPTDADSYILRGAVNVELKKFQAARSDFEQYLALVPEARDRDRVVEQIAIIDRYLTRRP